MALALKPNGLTVAGLVRYLCLPLHIPLRAATAASRKVSGRAPALDMLRGPAGLLGGLASGSGSGSGCRPRRRRSRRHVRGLEDSARDRDLIALGVHALQIGHVIAPLFRRLRFDGGGLAAHGVVGTKFAGSLGGAWKRR